MGVFKKKESSASAMIAPSGGGVPPAREPTKLKQSGAGGGHPAKVKSGYKNMDSSPAGHPADDILARGDNGYKYITEALGTFFLFLVGTRVGTFTASLTLAALTFMVQPPAERENPCPPVTLRASEVEETFPGPPSLSIRLLSFLSL